MKIEFNINDVFNHISKIENEWINYSSINLKGYWTTDDLAKYQPVFRLEMRVYFNEQTGYNKHLLESFKNNKLAYDLWFYKRVKTKHYDEYIYLINPKDIGWFTISQAIEIFKVSRQSINRNKKKFETLSYGLANRNLLYRCKDLNVHLD